MNSFIKQSTEKFPFSVDFVNVLNAEETISSLSVVAYDKDDIVVTNTIIHQSSIDGYLGIVVVKGGTHRMTYKITLSIVTSSGNMYEEDIFMKVNDV